MLPSWWGHLAKLLTGRRTPSRRGRRIGERRSWRPDLELLEGRLVPTSPTALAILRTTPIGPETNATSVSYTVYFNKSVTGVAAGDFQVTTDGTVQAASTVAVSGSGPVYTVTVNGIHGSGDLQLDLVDNGTINSGGVPLSGPGGVNGSFQGQTYNILQTDPYVLSINRDSPTSPITTATTVTYTVTFGTAVTGVSTSDFQLATTFTMSGTVSQVTPISSSVYDVTVSGITGTGTLGLNLVDNGTITDLVGNPLQQPNVPAFGVPYFATGNEPVSVMVGDLTGDGRSDLAVANHQSNTVGVLLANGNGTFQAQQTFAGGDGPISVALGDVNGDGIPDVIAASIYGGTASVLLGNGDGTFQAPELFHAGSVSSSVAVGDFNGDGRLDVAVANVLSANVSILLNGDTSDFAGPLYHSPVFVESINRAVPLGAETNATSVSYTVNFNEPVTGLASTDFQVTTDGSVQAASPVTVSGSGSAYTVTVSGIRGSGDLRLDLIDNGSIQSGGDQLSTPGGANGSFQGQTYNILQTFPSVVSINRDNPTGPITTATTVTYTVTFSTAVTGVTTSDFQLATTATISGTVSQVAPVSGSVYDVTVSGINGAGTLGLNLVDNTNIADLAGNPLVQPNVPPYGTPLFTTGNAPDAMTINDFNGDGNLDLAVVNTSDSTVGVLLGNGNGTFQPQQTFTVGFRPESMAVGYLNGDGVLDLVVANYSANTLSILMGNGNGTFQAQQTFATGIRPKAVVVGDLNGDGEPDIAVANLFGGSSIGVFLGNGNGTFQAQQTLATGIGPYALQVADLNGDGKLDLVTLNNGQGHAGPPLDPNTVGVFLGNGNGTFQAQQTFTTVSNPTAIVVADVNGDGRPDLVVSSVQGSYVEVLLGNGNGSFQAPQTFSAVGVTALAVADVNGDGSPDILLTNRNNATLGVLFGNGDGTFKAVSTVASPLASVAFSAVDVNHDGKLDLVVLNSFGNSAMVLLGNGNGTFQSQESPEHFAAGGAPLVSADLTGDGAVDLVTASNRTSSVTVLLSNGNGTFRGQQTFATGNGAQNVNGLVSVAVGDVNGDGIPDVAVTNYATKTVSVLLGNGNGTFQGQAAFATGKGPNFVALEDLNGDGKPDLVVTNRKDYTVGVLLSNGDGTFQAQQTFATGGLPYFAAIGDVNGDGRPDLAVANFYSNTVSLFISNGNGTFQAQLTFATGRAPTSVVMGDVNGDGSVDILVGARLNSAVTLFLGNGNGTFQTPSAIPVGNGPLNIALSDVNGDGIPDIIAGDAYSSSTSVILGNGNGTFQAYLQFGPNAGSTPVVADFNGDGRLDVAVPSSGTNVLLNTGTDEFTGQTYRSPVYVESINRAVPHGPLTNSTSVSYTVTFNEPVTGVQPADFQITNGGTLQTTVPVKVSGSGSTYTVTIDGIQGSGVLGLDLVNPGAIQGTDGPLEGSGPDSSVFDGQTYNIQQTDPYVVSINRATPAGSITTATSVVYTVTFSEPVTGVDSADFQVATTGTLTGMVSETTPSGSASVYRVTVGGITGDGTLGLNLVDNGTIHDLAGNPLTQQNGAISFQYQQQTLGPVLHRYSVALADVNGDGVPDLVVPVAGTHFANGTADVLLGNGNGTFQTAQTFATGNYSSSAAVGDLNGDGIPDLVVANSGPGRSSYDVSVLLGNGNGTFQAQQTFATFRYSHPFSVALDDVNADGTQDIVVADIGFSGTGGTVSVLLGNGNGTFQTEQTFATNPPFATGSGPVAVALGDVNGDGMPDIIVANKTVGTVGVLLSNGDGTFQAAQSFATGAAPFSVALGDVNGDGIPDLAVADSGSGAVSVLLGNGNGSFQAQHTFTAGYDPYSVALADINGDGKSDVVVTNGLHTGLVSVLLGNGDGTLQAAQPVASALGPAFVALGDLNSDGRIDIAVASFGNSVGVLLSTANGNFTGQIYTIDAVSPYVVSINRADANPFAGSTVHFTVTFSEPVTGVGPADFQLITTGGLGTTLTQVAPVSGSVYTVTVSGVTGTGTLGLNLVDNNSIRDSGGNALTQPNARLALEHVPVFATARGPYSATVGDVNGDGKPDIVTGNYNGTISVLLGNGNGTFQAQRTFAAPRSGVSFSGSLILSDLTGDGKLDVILPNDSGYGTVDVLLGNGDGTFQAQQTFATGTSTGSVLAVDVNGDGTPDLIASNSGSNTVSVLLGNGNGTFQAQQTFATGNGAGSITSGDVNRDGIVDLAVDSGSSSVSVLLGNGNGTFQAPQTFAVNTNGTAIALADLNGDGAADLVVSGPSSNLFGNVSVLLGNGNGTFQSQQTFTSGNVPSAVVATDLNGDGHPDLVVADEDSNAVSVLLGNGNGTFQAQQLFVAPQDPASMNLVDLTGNGKLDIVLANPNLNSVSVLFGNGDGTFRAQKFIDSAGQAWSFAIGDVNGDGAPDLVVGDLYEGTIAVLLGNGDGSFQSPQTFTTYNAPRSVALGDVNGDGIPDIVVADSTVNPIGGLPQFTVSVFLGNGNGTFQAQETFAVGSRDDLVVLADLNGDGKPDLVATGGDPWLSVLLGNGNGTFQAPQTFSVPNQASAVNASDLNGDGIPDLVVVNGSGACVLLGNGNGTFQAAQTFHTTINATPLAMTVGDVNGDGKPDIIAGGPAPNSSGGQVDVLLGNGDGTFQSPQTFATPNGPFGLNPSMNFSLGDLTGNGKLDLAIASDKYVYVLMGNGNGTYQAANTFPGEGGALSVLLGDLNSDGRPDLTFGQTYQDGMVVMLNQTNGDFTGQVYTIAQPAPATHFLITDPPTTAGSVLTFTVTALDQFNNTATGYTGSLDFISDDPRANLPNNAALLSGVGTFSATLYTAGTQTLTVTDVTNSSITGASNPISVSASPVTQLAISAPTSETAGTGFVLTVTAEDSFNNTVGSYNGSVQFSSSDSNAVLPAGGSLSGGFGIFSATLQSLGSQTLSVSGINKGNPTFAQEQGSPFSVNQDSDGLASGDFNNDGIPDLLDVSTDFSTVQVYLGNGNGTFAPAGDAVQVNLTDASVAVGDFNGDGNLDVAIPAGSNYIEVLLGNGDGTLARAASYAVGDRPSFIVAGHFSADGGEDLAALSVTGDSMSILLANPGGSFANQFGPPITYALGDAPTAAVVGDFNNDGRLDLAVVNSGDNDVEIFFGNGNGTFGAGQTFATGPDPSQIVAADFNGDGQLDLAVSNPSANEVNVLLGNGNGTFNAPTSYNGGPDPGNLVAADLNSDGIPDLVCTNVNNGTVGVLLGNGDGTFRPGPFIAVPTDSSTGLAIGDFTGSSIPDVALLYEGGLYVMLNQPLTGSATVDVGPAAASQFTVTAPTVAEAGQPFQFTVAALDGLGDVATGYTGTVVFTTGDAAATFPDNARLINGQGTFSATLQAIGSQTLTVADTNVTSISGVSSPINVMHPASPATHFVITDPPSTAGSNFVFTVTALDQFNDTATGYTGTLDFTSGDPHANLPENATLTNGVGTFSATLTTAGDLTITATDSTNPTLAGASPEIAVTPAATSQFVIRTLSNDSTAGNAFALAVLAEDPFNNIVPTYNGTVQLTSSDSQAVFSPDATLTSGNGYFAVILKTAGYQTITASDTTTGSISGVSSAIGVSPAAANHLAVIAAALPSYNGIPAAYPITPAAATSFANTGSPFTFTVAALDPYGNIAPTYAGTISFATSDTDRNVVLPAATTLSAGVGIFSATLQTAGTQSITVTDVSNASIRGIGTVVTRGLVVTSFTATPTGFTVSFNKAFNPSAVNLYTTGGLPDDVLLATTGTVVSIRGSLLINSTDSGITFVKTDTTTAVGSFNPATGLLAAGNYTVTLRSYNGTSGFQDTLGEFLDGTDTGHSGSNYIITFAVAAPQVAVGLPDFARGPSNTDALFVGPAVANGSTFTLSYSNPNANPTSATTTVTFSTNAATLQSNIQAALTSGGLATQVGSTTGTPNAVVIVTNDATTGANVLVTFQNGLATSTGHLLTTTTTGVSISTATINLPNNLPGDGIPIALSSGQNVTSGYFVLQYNPTLLSISGVTSKLTVGGATFTVVFNVESGTSGTLTLSLSSPSPISATTTAFTLGSLLATVPLSATASYGAQQLLHFSSEQLNGGAIAVTNQDAVQLAAYFGDTTDTAGPLKLLDAQAIAAIGGVSANAKLQTLPGFAAFPDLDPIIIGDVTSQGTVTTTDAGVMNQEAGGTARTAIPYAPIGLSVVPAGPGMGLRGPVVGSPSVADSKQVTPPGPPEIGAERSAERPSITAALVFTPGAQTTAGAVTSSAVQWSGTSSTQPAWSSETFLAELDQMQGRGFLLSPADLLLDGSTTDPIDPVGLEFHFGRQGIVRRR